MKTFTVTIELLLSDESVDPAAWVENAIIELLDADDGETIVDITSFEKQNTETHEA